MAISRDRASGAAKTDPRRVKGAPGRSARPGSKRERRLWESGHRLVAGVDEVGRGAWAGPLSVGVAVLCAPIARAPRGLRDSKQILEDDRERLFDKVAAWCTAWAVGHSEPQECDRLGMTAALGLATRRAFARLPEDLLPDAIVLDGNFDFISRAKDAGAPVEEPFPDLCAPRAHDTDGCADVALPASFDPVVHTVVKADTSCVSVAAASVLAKVTRDRIMRDIAESFPPFDFGRNKGYPSPTHQRALRGYGLSAIHRRSWVYVEKLPWADPESSRLRGRLNREPENAWGRRAPHSSR
ncbi:MAG: ribonuclease HII [Acidimicrobiales bacterium]